MSTQQKPFTPEQKIAVVKAFADYLLRLQQPAKPTKRAKRIKRILDDSSSYLGFK